MNEDLLAPPKLTVRINTIFVACVSGAAVMLGVLLAAQGLMSFRMLAWRVGEIGVFGGVFVVGYAWLFRLSLRWPPERMPWIHAIVGSMGMMVFYGVFGVMMRGTSIGQGMPAMLWVAPFVFATTLIGGGVTRRVGESLHCPQCEYEYAYDDPEDAPARCPECGSRWIGLLKKGRRVRSVRMIVIGVMVATMAAIIGNPIFYLGSVARHLPTPVLYAALYTAPGGVTSAWEELARRPLSERLVRSLCEEVIERRGRIAYDYGPNDWFETMAGAGKIPPDLEARYYRAGLRAELSVPRRVKGGEEFTASLRVRHAAAGSRMCMGVMFAGYDIGDGREGMARSTRTTWAHEMNPGMFEGHRDVLSQKLRAVRAGDMRVRATYWLVYHPSFMDALQWNADGTPVRPSAALWFEKVELEGVVRVE